MESASIGMKKYFEKINEEVRKAYRIANLAKSKGYDPEDKVSVPLAKNMAERVEGLISAVAPQIVGSGIVERIAELEKEYGSQDWRVALKIALEVAQEKFCKFRDKKEAMEVGIRVGLAYVTVGVVASPLEGFVELKIKNRADGKPYFCLMYSGPIRSAGGTAGAFSVVIADFVRKHMGYYPYDPTEEEIKRTFTELTDYHERVTNLQYYPSEEEAEFMTKHLPVQISGDASEKYEVSNYKGLPRIETDRIRSGFCLVMAECLCLKAPKLWKRLSKWAKDMGLEHWSFLEEFINLQKKIKAKGEISSSSENKITPDYTYIKDLVGGRPIITYPMREGGLRLRYGRCRNSGFSACALNPATMRVLNNYIAIGTQLKTERPGKAAVVMACDTIEGPIVKLNNGNVLKLKTEEEVEKYLKEIAEVIYLGDVLFNYGDFLNRAHRLVPCGFNEEWWLQCLKKKSVEEYKVYKTKREVKFEEAVNLSEKYNIPLHPAFIYYWNSITPEQFKLLFSIIKNSKIYEDKLVTRVLNEDEKRIFELIGVPHKFSIDKRVVIENDDAKAIIANLGELKKEEPKGKTALEMVNSLSRFEIKDKLGTFIGARMGRPEKAKERKLVGTPHMLFPVGKEGGRLRSIQSCLENGKITAQFPTYYCEKCRKNTIYPVCEICESKTIKLYYCEKCKDYIRNEKCPKHGKCSYSKRQAIDIKHYLEYALKKIGDKKYPDLIKGVRGMSSKKSIPENLVKGILRAKHGIYVNKDGTTRYDMTEMPCTHFKPIEIGTSVEKLRELGYTKDCFGNELRDENQILEIKPQDVILPSCRESGDELADDVLFRCANFIDECLVKLYGLKKYYNLKSKEDLVGKLCVALSPHTSAGIVVRIIGFSKIQGLLAHPLLHSALRRDCDGDEAAIMLLMDVLLNFSRDFLPNTRGATQDAPLVLTSNLIPSEVDDMVFDMDIVWEYPLEFYEAAEQYKQPWEVSIEKVGDNLGTQKQYEGMGFTHNTSDINKGVRCSAYKSMPTMQEKVIGQMEIAEKLRAVDTDDVARLVIEKHFLRDIKGNLRKFSIQQFRCVDCNEKYRRPPLSGKCESCGGKIIFTVSEGTITKYLEPSINLAKKYNLPKYMQQSLELLRERIESVFGKETEKQENLNKWF